MLITISIIGCVAQKINTKPQSVSMRGYNIEIPYTWTIYDNFDPKVSDFRFIAIDQDNGVLEIVPIEKDSEHELEKDILNNRLYLTDIQLTTTPKKSRPHKAYEKSIWNIASSNKQDNLGGEITIIENNGYNYAIMYYGDKSFCKSKELAQVLKSFALTEIPEIDPNAGISDSIKAQIPATIDMDKFAQTSDGCYKYDNWDVQFEFPNNWVVNKDESDTERLIFLAGNEDNNDYINLMVSTSPLATEESLDSMIIRRQSDKEIFSKKETKKIDNLTSTNYPFEIKEEGETMVYGEIIIFDDAQRYFYVVLMSHNKMSENTDINRLLNSFKIREWEHIEIDNDQIQIDISDE